MSPKGRRGLNKYSQILSKIKNEEFTSVLYINEQTTGHMQVMSAGPLPSYLLLKNWCYHVTNYIKNYLLTMFFCQCICLWEKELRGYCRHEPCFELHSLKLMLKDLCYEWGNSLLWLAERAGKLIIHWLLICTAVQIHTEELVIFSII